MRSSKEEVAKIIENHALNLKPGGTIHVHHCKEGKDNDRFYITRTDNGDYLYYCFHCGLRGCYHNNRRSNRRPREDRRDTETDRKQVTLPDDFTLDFPRWSIPAKTWVRRYGITDDELTANHVGYSERLGAVILPFFDEEGALLGYQYRPIDQEAARRGDLALSTQQKEAVRAAPKYLTRRSKDVQRGAPLFRAECSGGRSSDRAERDAPASVTIVEDVLSAIKVSRVPKNTGVALMGSSLSIDQAMRVSGMIPRKVYIFLDNDNPQVQENQKKAKKLMEPLVDCAVQIVESDRDPKEHTSDELEKLLARD